MDCRFCGLTNLPHHERCDGCDRPLQNAEEAAWRRRRWDELSSEARDQWLREHRRRRANHDEFRSWLLTYRLSTAILAGIAFSLIMTPAIVLAGAPAALMLADFLLGAAAATILNRMRGAFLRGGALFAAAFAASAVLKCTLGGVELIPSGGHAVSAFRFLWICAIVPAVSFGHYFGQRLQSEYLERNSFQ